MACNVFRSNAGLPLDPCTKALGKHIKTQNNGTVQASTSDGAAHIALFSLNRVDLVAFRRRITETVGLLRNAKTSQSKSLLLEFLGYPTDMPNLEKLHPPKGNVRPDGIAMSYFSRRRDGDLAASY